MARSYRKPMMNVEKFVANEYVAACGDKNKVYKFQCDAEGGWLYYYPNGDSTIDGQYTGTERAKLIGSYHPCGAAHEASVTSDFYDGFVDYNWNTKQDPGEGVIVWRGPRNNNGHATKNLNMDSWETAKS
ncbi:MAG: hypothetical protein MR729_00680 [Dorea sp.]|nr:hypothetical protein [Dorea sp.]